MRRLIGWGVLLAVVVLGSCTKNSTEKKEAEEAKTWGERLGYPADTRVLILHADDAGMCPEANQAVQSYLSDDRIQSSSVMVPCPAATDMLNWYKNHPDKDIGLHLTLTAEWQTYRWGPVAGVAKVPGLVDPDGYLWRSVPQVVQNATPEQVDTEIRAQIEKALSMGLKPGHVDTHMGTLYGSVDFAKVYLKAAMEYQIPAMVIEFTPDVISRFRQQGYPITDDMVAFASEYTLPKLDDFYAAPDGHSYEDKKEQFKSLVRSLKPGITEIIFHPSIETGNLKSITNSWQQRVWEAKMFADPEMMQFFQDEKILFTNWKEMMKRFSERS